MTTSTASERDSAVNGAHTHAADGFVPVKGVVGAEMSVLHLGSSRIGVIIEGIDASLALHDGKTGARAQCPVDRAQLLAVAGLMAEAAEKLKSA